MLVRLVERRQNLVQILIDIHLMHSYFQTINRNNGHNNYYTANRLPTDWIFHMCYKIHLNILKDTNYSDEVLQQDFGSWKDTCADRSTDKLTKSILSVVIIVAEHVLNHNAVLLPQISQTFLEIHGISLNKMAYLDVGETTIKFTSQWLIHQLLLYLHPYSGFPRFCHFQPKTVERCARMRTIKHALNCLLGRHGSV